MPHLQYTGRNLTKEMDSLRASVFTRCSDDPEKTEIQIIAHANPGGGVPAWATKTAVNALAPIEPFKLFHKINENVQRNRPQLRDLLEKAEMVGANMPKGRSPRPAGMAQLGYACFWPNGGGVFEGNLQRSKEETGQPNGTSLAETETESTAKQLQAPLGESSEMHSSQDTHVGEPVES